MSAKAAKAKVDAVINDNKYVVFSKSYCPYCARAKKLLKEEVGEDKLTVLELDLLEDGHALQDALLAKTGQRTVPNIFINQEHVGGSDDLTAAQKTGKLAKLLAV